MTPGLLNSNDLLPPPTRPPELRRARASSGPRPPPGTAVLVCLAILSVAMGGCTRVGSSGPAAPAPRPAPAIEAGSVSASAEATGTRLLRRAEEAEAAGDLAGALEQARTVVEEYPSVTGASTALLIVARTAVEVGDPAEAEAAAARYAELFAPSDDRAGQGRFHQGRARLAMGDVPAAVQSLTALPGGTPAELRTRALDLIRENVGRIETDDLARIIEGAPLESDLLAPVLVEYAVGRYFQGDEAEARRFAERARSLAADDRERRIADAVIDGRVEEALGAPPTLGALLPVSGSPSMREYAAYVEEGIRLALEDEEARTRRPVRLEVLDSGGRADRAAEMLAQLEESGAAAILGPLRDDELASVASARRRPLPVISPTAHPAADAPGVYSLAGPDPGAARTLARYTRRSGIRTVALLFPRLPEATYEAEVFAEAFRGEGGTVVREITYQPGQTFFKDEMGTVARLRPDALVLPLPPRDIELVAPQVTFYGLDTLGVQVVGTEAWADDRVLRKVAPRHTDGVISITPAAGEAAREARERFVASYESFYRKSLRSDVPALGYDIARLALQAFQTGARRPEDVRRALEGIQGYQGVTGSFSIANGRVLREYTVVRLMNREAVPVFDAFD